MVKTKTLTNLGSRLLTRLVVNLEEIPNVLIVEARKTTQSRSVEQERLSVTNVERLGTIKQYVEIHKLSQLLVREQDTSRLSIARELQPRSKMIQSLIN